MLAARCVSVSVESAAVLLRRAAGVPLDGEQRRFRRRTLTPAPWLPPKEPPFLSLLSESERREFEQSDEFAYLRQPAAPPAGGMGEVVLSKPLPAEAPVWTPESRRCGLIARKIGMLPQWQTDGTRVLCTLLEIPTNHVLWSMDPDTWFRRTLIGKRKAFNRAGPLWQVMVGAVDVDPTFLSAPYRRVFERAGVPCKDRMAGFLATEDAVLQPGTQLDVRHFRVGQFVAVSGKTIDWGFQGVMHRWGMRGQPARNTTKSHRRVGSTGSKGDARVWPGKRLAGHMGYEWRQTSGLEILRINPLKQVMYVKGCVPGDAGELLLVKDCLIPKKRAENPPFPTFVRSEVDVMPRIDEEPADCSLAEITKHDEFSPKLFRFTSPSIVFTEADETPLAARDKSRAKTAKVKK